MSEHAVNARWDEFRERLSTGIRATILLILPAAVGYFVLSERIVRLLLERGIFSPESTHLVGGVLRFFVLGLVPFSLFQLFLRAFYAMQDTRTPFWINCAAVAANTAINLPMYQWLGVKGLAAGHAMAYTFGAIVQARVLSKRIDGLDGRRVRATAIRIGVAGAGMGIITWLTAALFDSLIGSTGTGAQLIGLGGAVLAGVVAYLGLATVFRVDELALVRGLVTRRGS